MQVAAGWSDRRLTPSTIRKFSPLVRALAVASSFGALLLAGCGTSAHLLSSADTAASLAGSVHSAGHPLSNAHVQLYAAGDASGQANTPLLQQPVVTGSSGAFSIPESFTCPSPSSQLYLVATGGAVAAHPASSNSATTLIAALGTCSDISPTHDINELTTAAAIAAIAPFMPSIDTLGAPAINQPALRDAFTAAANLSQTLQQVNADPTLPPAQLDSIQKLATLANILSACTATTGGSPGDGTPCGTLFSYTQSAPDTASALLDILAHPTRNVASIFALSPSSATFHPALSAAPLDWSIDLGDAPPQPTASPAPGTYAHPQTITLTDDAPNARIFYSIDGVWHPYTTPFTLPASTSIQTMALSTAVSHTSVVSYAITTPRLVFLTQPASTSAGAILSPPPSVAIQDSTGAILSSANYPVTLALASNSSGAALNGVTTATAVNGIATFTGLSIPMPGMGYTLTASAGATSSATSSAFNNTGAINLIPMATTLTSGQSSSGFFTLSQAAPAGGVLVALASSNPAITSISPATQTVPQGQSSGNFTYKNVGLGSVTLSGSASGFNTGTVQIATAGVSLSVTPLNLTINPAQSQLFSAAVTGSLNTAVTWSISPATGSISSTGLYTAPASVSSAQAVTVTATSIADPTKKGASTFWLPASVNLAVTPLNATLAASKSQQFSASTTAVSWSISPSIGSISPTGLYTAPSSANPGQTITVTAISTTDSTRRASATLLLASPVAVSLTPGSATVAAGATQQFSSTVTGTTQIALTWSISPAIGSITQYGLYTAPASFVPGQVVSVVATSVADPTRSAYVPVSLILPATRPVTNPVAVTLTPGTATVAAGATQQFSTAVTGTTNTALVWSISPALGSITQYGLYTAPTSFVPGQVVNVVATSVADPSRSAYSPVSLTAAPAAQPAPVSSSGIGVAITPASVSLYASQIQQYSVSVTGTRNTSITFSVSPAVGSVSQVGLYTAPASITSAQTVSVIATSNADGISRAVSTVALIPPITFAASATVPANFFGMSVFNFKTTLPPLPFGTARSWDSSPDLSWAASNPARGLYNFAPVDSFIATNQARGAEMIYTLGRTPQWASSLPNQPGNYGPGQCATPANYADYDAYVSALATHAAGRIKYWELGNEVDDPRYYCGDVASQVVLAQHAYRIIKSIDPTAVILSPSPTGGPGPAWLASFLALGGGNSVDIIAFHGYASASAEDFVGIVSGYRAVMAAAGIPSKPMWDTESSWAGTGSIGTPTSPAQVGFIAKDYLLHWSQGISRFVWYAYDGGNVWGGLLTPSNTPSPAVTSYAQTYKWMVGASLSSPCSEDLLTQIWTCGLTRSNGYQAQAIWLTGSSRTVTVPSQFTDYRDLTGNVIPITNHTVTIGDQPLLLESSPLQ